MFLSYIDQATQDMLIGMFYVFIILLIAIIATKEIRDFFKQILNNKNEK
jgi:Na+-transporting methylmalonyl-CoA/oxaloacetate decarboxylase gamma subunit